MRIGSNNPLKGPFTVVVSVTNKCNVKCPGCLAFHDRGQELSRGQLGEMFRIFSDYEVKRISFAGGEPLMRNDILDIVSDAHNLGFMTALCTNGTLLTWDVVERLGEHLNELIVPFHSTDPSVSMHLTPYADAGHIARISGLIEKICAEEDIQIKPQTILSRVTANIEGLITTGNRLHELGANVWKIDQYYHVDKPNALRLKFGMENHEYNVFMDLLRRTFANMLKVVGIGGTFRFGKTGFLVSSAGNAFVNVDGGPDDKILGNIFREHPRLFTGFNTPVMPSEDYAVIERGSLSRSRHPLDDYQLQTIHWVEDFIMFANIRPQQTLVHINAGIAAEFISGCAFLGVNVHAFERDHHEVLEKLTLLSKIRMINDGMSMRGGYSIHAGRFADSDALKEEEVDTVVLSNTGGDVDKMLPDILDDLLKALFVLKDGGQIVTTAPSTEDGRFSLLITQALQYLGIKYNIPATGSVSRPFLPGFGFFHVYRIEDKIDLGDKKKLRALKDAILDYISRESGLSLADKLL